MRISDWGSDVCSSDLPHRAEAVDGAVPHEPVEEDQFLVGKAGIGLAHRQKLAVFGPASECIIGIIARSLAVPALGIHHHARSEERRVGKECVRTGRSRWWPDHSKKKEKNMKTYK